MVIVCIGSFSCVRKGRAGEGVVYLLCRHANVSDIWEIEFVLRMSCICIYIYVYFESFRFQTVGIFIYYYHSRRMIR